MDFRYLGFWPGVIFRIFWRIGTKKGLKNQFQKIGNLPQKKVKKCFRKNRSKKNSKKSLRSDMAKFKTRGSWKYFLRFLKNICGVVGCLN